MSRPVLPAADAEVLNSRREELKLRLSGVSKETSYRHELQTMDAGQVMSEVSSNGFACALISYLIKARNATRVVEFGSAFGLASLAAVCSLRTGQESKNFVGIELEDWRAEIANEGLRCSPHVKAIVHAGAIENVMGAMNKPQCEGVTFDFAFVDAMHTYEATVGYHNMLQQFLNNGAWVLYDDVNWSAGMEDAWKSIVESDRVSDALLIEKRWGLVRYEINK